jgi:hypothetical protein
MDSCPETAIAPHPVRPSIPSPAPDAEDRRERSPTTSATDRAMARWLVEALLRGGAAGATLCGGVWRDPTTFLPTDEPTRRQEKPHVRLDRKTIVPPSRRILRAPVNAGR